MKIPVRPLIRRSPLFLAALIVGAASATAKPDSMVAPSAEIDRRVAAKLQQQGIEPNAPASDEVFVRRAYLDIVGRIPSATEALAFIESGEPEKRAQLIDHLLDSEGYVQHFYNYWADLLRMKSAGTGGNQSLPAGLAYARFIKESLAENKPYDQLVRELLTAQGKTYENGAVGFYMRDYNMQLDNMAVTTQVFLGTQMVCAQCHDHPFDKWSQMDYYQMAAHTYGIRGTNTLRRLDSGASLYGQSKNAKKGDRKTAAYELGKAMTEILRPLRYNVIEETDRSLRLPHDYAYEDAKPLSVVAPAIPASFSAKGTNIDGGESPVPAYAEWMTDKGNPRFSLVIANRLWKKAMGYGVIEPVDELTDSTVPSNPELMTYLEDLMKSLDYDMKAYLRVIYNTDTYQRAAHTEDIGMAEPYYFQGPVVRRMTAEQIWDSMNTLIRPDPDAISSESEQTTDYHLTKVRWMDQALNALNDEELAKGAREIADLQKKLANDVRQAQLDLVKAQEQKDEAGIRKAKGIISKQRSTINEAVEDIVFQMGYVKFLQLAKSGKLKEQADPETAAELTRLIKTKKGDKLTFDEALAAVQRIQREKATKIDEARKDELKASLGVGKSQSKEFSRYVAMLEKTAVRAADVRSPAPAGHFLREFGQSDRELIDNANPDATVGQALMMMNGSYFEGLLNPFTVIARALEKAKTPGETVDTLYLSLMSRHATDEEKKLLEPVLTQNPDKGTAEVLWALLNTKQFLFVQ